MRAEAVTFGEVGTIRAQLRNPYRTARRFDIEVFDTNWQPVAGARLTRQSLTLAPGGVTSILAIVPVAADGAGTDDQRTVHLCATSSAYSRASAGLRGQVCGRYQLRRVAF